MNNSNSIQELIRQGLYNLENTLKKLIAPQESKKGKEKESLAILQSRQILANTYLALKGLKKSLLQREQGQEQELTHTPQDLRPKKIPRLGVSKASNRVSKDQPTIATSTLPMPKPIRPTSTTTQTQVVKRKNKILSLAIQHPQVQPLAT